MSSDIVKRKSNGSTQVKPNQIAKIKPNEKALATSSSKTPSSTQKSNIDVNTTTKDDEEILEGTLDRISDEERHHEIDSINEGSVEDALGRYNLSSKKETESMFRKLSGLTHPDKEHDPEWKIRAKMAQQSKFNARFCQRMQLTPISELNKSREFFASAPDSISQNSVSADSTSVNPKSVYKHDNFWNQKFPSSAIRSLQIDPNSVNGTFFIEETNKNVQNYNLKQGYPVDSGLFPLKYLKTKYSEAHNIMNKYKEANDQEKNEIKIIFDKLVESTVEYCSDNSLPRTWAWQHSDITSKPQWLDVTERSELDSQVAAARALESGPAVDAEMTDDFLTSKDDITTNDDINKDKYTTSTNDVSSITVNGKNVIAKRAVFKTFQYLIQMTDDLRVWVPAQFCGNVESEKVETLALKSKEFIKDRKYQYSCTLWIALGIDAVVTEELRYPPIAMMVHWLDDKPDSLLWRSDVIKIAGKTITQAEVMSRLNYQQELDINGTNLIVMAASENALSLGSTKLLAKISDKQKRLTLSQLFHRQSAPQSSAPKDSSIQSNEALLRIVQEAVEAAIQAKFQLNTTVQLPS